ncbi:MAG: S1 RNA-binding domain-containing protein, partial [Chloroflexota bacterium]|nr:S1 RNA-binding domain-containing protein [Chloroflexota bacterium]
MNDSSKVVPVPEEDMAEGASATTPEAEAESQVNSTDVTEATSVEPNGEAMPEEIVAEEAEAVAEAEVEVEVEAEVVAEAEAEVEAEAEAVAEAEAEVEVEAEVVTEAEAEVEAEAEAVAEAEVEVEVEAEVVAEAEAEVEAEAEAEVEAADEDDVEFDLESIESTEISMEEFVADFEFKPLRSGEIRDGVVVSITPSEILVDVGAKSEGFIHNREMERMGKEYRESLNVGDPVVVYVVRPEDRDGNVVLSLSRAQQERDWREAEVFLESGQIFESSVIGFNRGGVICRLGKVRGFIPASQLVTKPERPAEGGEEDRWSGLVGENLWLKVVELDRRRNRLILSERLAVRDRRRQKKEELLSELKKGDVRKGRVSSLAKFGAFVDLGGADGLVHVSELSWSRVNHPSEVVSVGDEVEVYVLNVDPERRRIGLSMRRIEPEPWSVVHDRYAVGQIVDGVITKLASFGAFARIDGMIEGLIHISELANHRVTHPKEVVSEGDALSLRIIRIDPARRRMGLSLKRATEDEYAELDWREGEDNVEPVTAEKDEDEVTDS